MSDSKIDWSRYAAFASGVIIGGSVVYGLRESVGEFLFSKSVEDANKEGKIVALETSASPSFSETARSTDKGEKISDSGWLVEKESSIWAGIRCSLKLNELGKLFDVQSAIQRVQVWSTSHFGNALVLDGAIQCTERDESCYQEMLAHVGVMGCAVTTPLVVVVIGGGDGGVSRELLKYSESQVKSVALCEIDVVVMQAAKEFLPKMASGLDTNQHPRLQIHCLDGLGYLESLPDSSVDLLIVDSSDPEGPADPLFGRSFFSEARRVITSQGLLLQQAENAFLAASLVRNMVGASRDAGFTSTKYASFPITTYPGGNIGILVSTGSTTDPAIPKNVPCLDNLSVYTPAFHNAIFQLPKYIHDSLNSSQTTQEQ